MIKINDENNEINLQKQDLYIATIEPILYIVNKKSRKRIYNLNKIYKNEAFHENSQSDKNIIIEIINNEINKSNITFKIHLICKKEVNEDEYNNRHKFLIKFNNLFKKYLKKKYDKDIKDKHIYYTDVSYKDNDKYILHFYIVVSQEFGILKNPNNIKILISEFNNILKTQSINFFQNFIDLNIYNKDYFKNVFTYINKDTNLINIYNGNLSKSKNIYNKHYFLKNLIGFYGIIDNLLVLDNNIITIDTFFNKV